MQVTQLLWDHDQSWRPASHPTPAPLHIEAELILVFGSRDALSDERQDPWIALSQLFPNAAIVSCSGGGQITGVDVVDETMVATAVGLHSGHVVAVATTHGFDEESADVGARLAGQLPTTGLRYVLVLSDGLRVNGSALVRGMTGALPHDVTLSGGLAGDAGEFAATLVGLNGPPASGQIVAVGFYGDRLSIAHGSLGGWEMFGPDRRVTRATGNVVHELDGQPALALYKRYLGTFADDLPASALLFPLCLQAHAQAEHGLVRTVLGVSEADDSMTFAGDVPEGASVRLMRTSREGLIAGAEGAAAIARRGLGGLSPELVLLVSCIGRRLVLKHRVDEELESARDAMGPTGVFTGFYSFGEIAPTEAGESSALHNQTMTVTALAEY